MLPRRIYTGLRNQTIPNPVYLAGTFSNAREVFNGPVRDYTFHKQTDNFISLQEVLARHGMQLTQVAGVMYDGDRGYNHRFVASNDAGTVIWHKYVGFIAQSGQNHVFIHGMRIKVSCFLSMKKTQQAALLSGDKARIAALGLGYYDEQGTLWN